jgi:Protein of unknown function (DUF2817)
LNSQSSRSYKKVNWLFECKSVLEFYFKLPLAILMSFGARAGLKKGLIGGDVSAGQKEFPKGVFYSGLETQPEITHLLYFLKEKFPATKRWIFFDVHSGLGAFAEESLIVDSIQSQGDLEKEKSFFTNALNAQIVVPHLTAGFSAVHGMLAQAMKRVLGAHQSVYYLTQEFGTYPTLRVASQLALEFQQNRNKNNKGAKFRKRSLELFFPSNPNWRKRCIELAIQRVWQLNVYIAANKSI